MDQRGSKHVGVVLKHYCKSNELYFFGWHFGRCSCAASYSRRLLDVSGQIHAPATLTLERTFVHIEKGGWVGLRAGLDFWRWETWVDNDKKYVEDWCGCVFG